MTLVLSTRAQPVGAPEQPLTAERLSLRAERLGALPLINHFIRRLDLARHLEDFVPTTDRRIRLPYAKALGVLLRSLLIEREPMYCQHETVSTFAPAAFGLDAELAERVGDDAVGRALDRLFDADRAALMTAVVIAPVLLKNEGRIEALFFVYFLALLVQALIERELRLAMQRNGIATLALYPEERSTTRPTAEQVFRLFSLTQRHVLEHDGRYVRSFEPELTALQREVLDLLGVPRNGYLKT
jgi:hypothetical protein